MNLDPVLMSRLLTTMTLGFHIIFATLGVGVPLMISIAEFIGIRKKDPHYLLMARRWARGFVITVAIGVVTGTAIGLQLSLLWPNFMQVAGNVISLPLFMEVFAFFFEAIFLGIYLYTWDRFRNPYIHWSFSIPVIIGGGMSAVFITTVNAFMNTPEGFTIGESGFASINPIQTMLNPATPTKVFHVVSTAYVTVAAILVTIAAFALLKNKASNYHKKALKLTLTLTFIFALLSAVAGDLSAKFLAEHQPEKLAAAEWHFDTEENADLVLFGWLDKDGEASGEIRIPGMLSFLAHGDFNSKVTGLSETPEDEQPPLWIHYMFDLMVMIGVLLAAVPVLYFILSKVKRWNANHKWMLRLLVLAGPLAVAAIEFGWILAEEGRQPWILRGFMKVEEAATTSPHVGLMFIFFFVLYAVLGTLCIVILRRIFRDKPAMDELQETYPEMVAKLPGTNYGAADTISETIDDPSKANKNHSETSDVPPNRGEDHSEIGSFHSETDDVLPNKDGNQSETAKPHSETGSFRSKTADHHSETDNGRSDTYDDKPKSDDAFKKTHSRSTNENTETGKENE